MTWDNIVGSDDSYMFSFWGTSIQISVVTALIDIPTKLYIHFSLHSHQHLLSCISLSSLINKFCSYTILYMYTMYSFYSSLPFLSPLQHTHTYTLLATFAISSCCVLALILFSIPLSLLRAVCLILSSELPIRSLWNHHWVDIWILCLPLSKNQLVDSRSIVCSRTSWILSLFIADY